MPDMIPFLSLDPQLKSIRSELSTAVSDVMNSRSFILGKAVTTFEKKYASFSKVDHCISVGNGFDALQLSLKALDIGKGDEVIVPSNTCIPTWLAVSSVGATVVPVEPDLHTSNVNPSLVEAAITSRTKAIIPVHLYGQACEMDQLISISRKAGIHLIEDNAQGHGSSFRKQLTGSFGIVNATSFYPTKNLGAFGDGGAVTTNDEALAQKISRLRNYGSSSKDHFAEKGINSRLDELQATILTVKLKKLATWNNQRKAIAKNYLEHLDNIDALSLPKTAYGCDHVYHLFVIRTDRRDELRSWLFKKKVETMIHYPVPPHLQPAYKDHGFKKGQFPIAEQISKTCLSLPCWPGLESDRVIDALQALFSKRN